MSEFYSLEGEYEEYGNTKKLKTQKYSRKSKLRNQS